MCAAISKDEVSADSNNPARPEESIDARCAACGTVWAPPQFKYLAEQISKAQETTVHTDGSGS